MWIIRFNKIKPRDYNYIKRQTKKAGFISRKIPPIIFIKGVIFHLLQKKSWRNIANTLGVNHIMLFNFYTKYGNNNEIIKILEYFIESKIIIFVPNNNNFSISYLDGEKFLEKSKIEFKKLISS